MTMNWIQFNVIVDILKLILFIIPLLISVAYLTLAERNILSAMQLRQGPKVVGFAGLLQPLADGLKLLIKEPIIPIYANRMLFLLAPIITFSLSLFNWFIIPFDENSMLVHFNLGILFLFAISSLGVYGIILSGWSSNSKYAFLGALRAAAQMISYEVSIGLIIISVISCVASFDLFDIVKYQSDVFFIIPLLPSFFMFFISALAETNRAPFDLPEAEAELVSGYNVEYSSMGFALFFLGEYANIILMSTLTVLCFLGGWLPMFSLEFFLAIPHNLWLALKVTLFVFVFVWVRGTYPRYRYDQLMSLGWKVFLPVSLGWLFLTVGILYGTHAVFSPMYIFNELNINMIAI